MPSFTNQNPNLQLNGPVVDLHIAVGAPVEDALKRSGQDVPEPIQISAMIDTGASRSVITETLAQQLGLNPVGLVYINTPSSTGVRCCEYIVRLLFPNRVMCEATVIEAPLKHQNIQCLIGRDILSHGVLVYVGYTNTFTLSF